MEDIIDDDDTVNDTTNNFLNISAWSNMNKGKLTSRILKNETDGLTLRKKQFERFF